MLTVKNDFILDLYVKEAHSYPLLTHQREIELSHIILDSDNPKDIDRAKTELVESNLRLVIKWARKMYNKMSSGYNDINLTIMDLIQIGNIGLTQAANLFDGKKQYKFSTYAFPAVNRYMLRAIKESRTIRIPEEHFKYLLIMKNAGIKDRKQIDDLANLIDVSPDMFERLLKDISSSRAHIGNWDLFIGNVKDERAEPLEQSFSRRDMKRFLYEELKRLKPVERDLLFYTYFVEDPMPHTYIARKYNISGERVRQILPECIAKFKDRLGGIKIKRQMAHSKTGEVISREADLTWDELEQLAEEIRIYIMGKEGLTIDEYIDKAKNIDPSRLGYRKGGAIRFESKLQLFFPDAVYLAMKEKTSDGSQIKFTSEDIDFVKNNMCKGTSWLSQRLYTTDEMINMLISEITWAGI